MIITVDTNVIFSALYSCRGASHYVLRLILDEEVKLALSYPVYLEYYDVLTRAENLRILNLSVSEVEDVLDLLVLLAKQYDIYFLLRPNLVDEKDNILIECAFASNSTYLITSNIRDFQRGELKGFGFNVITPKDFCQQWRGTR
jgi:putative PIN family toxin of toxin-antitoxin system